MRFHEGNFAYNIEPYRDPGTRLLSAWKFTVFQVRPAESVVARGEAKTREEAEAQAKEIVDRLKNNSGRAA